MSWHVMSKPVMSKPVMTKLVTFQRCAVEACDAQTMRWKQKQSSVKYEGPIAMATVGEGN